MMKSPLVIFLLLSCFYQPSWGYNKICLFCEGNSRRIVCSGVTVFRQCYYSANWYGIPCLKSIPNCCDTPDEFTQSAIDRYCRRVKGARTSPTTTSITTTSRDECKSPTETCDWYRNCLQSQFPQCQGSENYALSFGERYCKKYDERYQEFSDKGKRWIDSVRKCLQEKLIERLAKPPSLSCSLLKDFAFETHAPCYTNAGEDNSVCQLSCGDIFQMFWTTKGSLVSREFWRVYRSATEVSSSCKFQDSSFGFNVCFFAPKWVAEEVLVPRAVKPLFRLAKFVVSYRAREKRSVGCDDQCFAEKIVEEFIARLSLPSNHTLEWFVFPESIDGMLNVELVLSDASLLNATNDANYNVSLSQFSDITQDLLMEIADTEELMVNGQLLTINQTLSCDNANCEEAPTNSSTTTPATREEQSKLSFL